MTVGEIQTNPPLRGRLSVSSPRSLTRSHLTRHVHQRQWPLSLSQLRLTLQIILSISGGAVTEQVSDHLCNYDRQPVTVVSSRHFIALH